MPKWRQQVADLEDFAPEIVRTGSLGGYIPPLNRGHPYDGPRLDGDNLFRVYDSKGLIPAPFDATTPDDWQRFLGLTSAKAWWGMKMGMTVQDYRRGVWTGGARLRYENTRPFCLEFCKTIGVRNLDKMVDAWEKATRGDLLTAKEAEEVYA